ncbi:MAG: hypothetical protein IT383_07705, partial [Deltaproteobacteria bacterium]|nr:hypothetical protein [Deltaproteobacteria bacterium]
CGPDAGGGTGATAASVAVACSGDSAASFFIASTSNDSWALLVHSFFVDCLRASSTIERTADGCHVVTEEVTLVLPAYDGG